MFWLIEVHLLDFLSQPWKWVVLVWCSPTPIFHIDFEKIQPTYNLVYQNSKCKNKCIFPLFKKIHSQNNFFDFLNLSFFRPFVVEKQILKGLFWFAFWVLFWSKCPFLSDILRTFLSRFSFWGLFWVTLFAQDTFLRKPSFLRTFKSLFFYLYFFEDF